MDGNIRFDAVRLKAELTPEGYLRDSPIVARSGVQEYRRADGGIRREYRPPEVVFDAATLANLAGIPIIDTHVGMMSAANVRKHAIGTVLSQGRQDGENMVADIVIHDPTPVTRHGRKELSLAYTVRCDETPGTTPEGTPYDAKVTAITGFNHLAIVERGRAGVARLRLDSDDAVSTDIMNVEIVDREDTEDMSVQNTNGQAPQNNAPAPRPMVSIRVDGLDYPAAPEVERAYARLNEQLTAANKRADTAEAERDSLRTQVTQHEANVAQVRADTAAQIRTRITLEATAKDHGVEVRSDDSDRAIRENVIRKIDGDAQARFDGKSDDYVSALFDSAITRHSQNKRQNDANRAAVNGAGQVVVAPRADGATAIPAVPVINSARVARDLMMRRGRL